MTPIETERKYIIEMPSDAFLAGAVACHIAQTYLVPLAPGENRRVRRATYIDHVKLTTTTKRRISGMSCYEEERELDEAEYQALLADARPDSVTVEKIRYTCPYDGRILEIDVYPFWVDHAILEVELSSEEESVSFPKELRIVREVTEDGMYKNTNIAKFLHDDPDLPLPI